MATNNDTAIALLHQMLDAANTAIKEDANTQSLGKDVFTYKPPFHLRPLIEATKQVSAFLREYYGDVTT